MSTKLPAWLPEMILVNPWDDETYENLYAVFKADFIDNSVKYKNIRVVYDGKIIDGKEATFWKITTRDDVKQGCRLPDPRRCERLSWLKPIIENHQDDEVLCWELQEPKGVVKAYIWLRKFDYIAILKKMSRGGWFLLSAHWVEYENYKRKLLGKYKKSLQESGG